MDKRTKSPIRNSIISSDYQSPEKYMKIGETQFFLDKMETSIPTGTFRVLIIMVRN